MSNGKTPIFSYTLTFTRGIQYQTRQVRSFDKTITLDVIIFYGSKI